MLDLKKMFEIERAMSLIKTNFNDLKKNYEKLNYSTTEVDLQIH